MATFLILRLEGPLQSWGIRSRWDVRDSAREPTKSAIIGLLGCCLGIRRGDPSLEDLSGRLIVGVRTEYGGTMIEDFHTVTGDMTRADGSHGHKTIVSRRTYIQDAAFLVTIGVRHPEDRQLLERCCLAVQQPVWPIYLGRKSCVPSRPIFECVTEHYGDLQSLLESHETLPQRRRPGSGQYLEGVMDCISPVQPDAWVNDEIRTNRSRSYDQRAVRYTKIRRENLPVKGGSK